MGVITAIIMDTMVTGEARGGREEAIHIHSVSEEDRGCISNFDLPSF